MALGFGPLGGAPLASSGNLPLDLGSGTYTLTGRSATLGVGMPAGAGSYSLAGFTSVFGDKLPLGAGSYSITGNAAFGIGIPLGVGSYALSGFAARFGENIPVVAGSYVLTGFSANFAAFENLGFGSYSLAGQPVIFRVNTFEATGSYTLTGGSAVFAYVPRFAFAGGFYKIGIHGAGALPGFGPIGAAPIGATGDMVPAVTFGIGLLLVGSSFTFTGGSVTFARISLGSINPRLALRRRPPFSGTIRRVSGPQQLRRVYKYPTRSNG